MFDFFGISIFSQWRYLTFINDEFERFGKNYYDEAKRILTHMPRLPRKYGS